MSAFLIVLSLWAITKLVLPFIRLSMALWILCSVLVSTDDVASSRIITGLSARIALAIVRSCLWPAETLDASSFNSKSYPPGNVLMKWCAWADLAAAITSSSVASSLPYLIFSIIEPLNNHVSWRTIPKALRSSFLL